MSNMRVLITGGSGFIGSHLAEYLVAAGHWVVVVDNFLSGNPENLEGVSGRRLRIVRADFTRPEVLRVALKDVDVVIHEAAVTGLDACLAWPSLARHVNIKGTERLLAESLRAGVGRVVFASSAAVYGEQEKLPISEDAVLHPLSLYGETKLEGERLCQEYFKRGLQTVCLRYFNVYGPRQNPAYAGVILKFLRCLKEGGRPVIYGDGSQTRDFIHVSDVVRATVLALQKDCAGEAINVGTGVPTSVSQLLQTICELAGKRMRPRRLPPRANEIKHSQADVTKAERVLGFKASIPLEDGLRALIGG